MKLGISERDKMLLCVVASALLVFLAYYFGYRNYTNKTEALNSEIATLQSKYDDLQAKQANVKQYKIDITAFEDEYERIMSKYDSGFSQKATLLFTGALESELDVWIRSVGMPDATSIYTFGNITSTNPSNSGSRVYSTDMVAYKKSFTYSYECSYSEFKEFLDYILNYDTRYTIDSVSCSYNEEDDIISGTISICQYAITGSERPYYEPEIDSITLGTENIFVSEENPDKYVEENEDFEIMNTYDLALSLNSAASDLSSVVIGRRNLISSQISDNANDVTEVVLNIDGSEGLYTISYTIGENSYPAENPAEGVVFTPGRKLDLIVFSSKREGNNDKAGVKLIVNNNSDMTLNIKILNDDEVSPRFNIEVNEGRVKYYR